MTSRYLPSAILRLGLHGRFVIGECSEQSSRQTLRIKFRLDGREDRDGRDSLPMPARRHVRAISIRLEFGTLDSPGGNSATSALRQPTVDLRGFASIVQQPLV